MKMLNKELCEKAVQSAEEKTTEIEDYNSIPTSTCCWIEEELSVFKQLIKEHYEIVGLIEKWGLSDLSVKELDEWHDRCIWHVNKCNELHDELTKANDYYFRIEKAIEVLFGVSADELLEEYEKKGADEE